jgi:glycosyltransferase involved in cell wall biosynthesis
VKIAFVVSGKSALTMPGGLGAYAHNACRIFKALGYRVYLVGYSDRDESIDMDFGALVHVRTPWNRLASMGMVLIAPYLVARMQTIVEAERPDETLVFGAGIWGIAGTRLQRKMANRFGPTLTLAGYFTTYQHEYAGQIKGAPARDYGFFQYFKLRLIELAARLVFVPIEHRMLCALDRVIVHYESTRKILLDEVACIEAERICKTPYYVDLYDRHSDVGTPQRPDAAPRITMLCRQDPRKGINSFLHAIRQLQDRGVDFSCAIAGKGYFLEQNRRLARRLGIGERVMFPGFVESVEDFLGETDIFVLPSVEEGSGSIALLEAMKQGVAIITTRCDGMPEDFIDGETALLVDPDDPRQLAAALERLTGDAGLRKRLARNVREDYTRRFSFTAMQQGLSGVLDGIRR